MAAEFLRSHGIDIDSEMARIQAEPNASNASAMPTATTIENVSLPGTERGTLWDVSITGGNIAKITPRQVSNPTANPQATIIKGNGALLAPSLCHPHIHIDKAYLLSHPRYAHLRIQSGDFKEAMALTGEAKAQFTEKDLLERGQRVIDESIAAGVTHMRAFVEIDAIVGTKCLDAGILLKKKAEERGCLVQICAFAQLPIFSPSEGDADGGIIRDLMLQAARNIEVDVLGSTPYVESDRKTAEQNVHWMIALCAVAEKHLDFHLDYNVDSTVEPMVWHVIQSLREAKWNERIMTKTIVLGHCTRLTLFDDNDWKRLRDGIGDLPISFVGLPTSDLFMMRTPERTRGTLDVLELIQNHHINACLGINNIGNAFTPHGSCDPLMLACHGIGVYQSGTKRAAEILYECVSTRARKAIGLSEDESLVLKEGDAADVVLFAAGEEDWKKRKTIADAVYFYDNCRGRSPLR